MAFHEKAEVDVEKQFMVQTVKIVQMIMYKLLQDEGISVSELRSCLAASFSETQVPNGVYEACKFLLHLQGQEMWEEVCTLDISPPSLNKSFDKVAETIFDYGYDWIKVVTLFCDSFLLAQRVYISGDDSGVTSICIMLSQFVYMHLKWWISLNGGWDNFPNQINRDQFCLYKFGRSSLSFDEFAAIVSAFELGGSLYDATRGDPKSNCKQQSSALK